MGQMVRPRLDIARSAWQMGRWDRRRKIIGQGELGDFRPRCPHCSVFLHNLRTKQGVSNVPARIWRDPLGYLKHAGLRSCRHLCSASERDDSLLRSACGFQHEDRRPHAVGFRFL